MGREFDSMVSLFVSAVCLLSPQPSECEQCTCDSDGIARCLVADCAPPPCVNPVYQPGKCCPECQDGMWQITSGAFCSEQCGQLSRVQSWGSTSPLKKVGLLFIYLFVVEMELVENIKKTQKQWVDGSMLSSLIFKAGIQVLCE